VSHSTSTNSSSLTFPPLFSVESQPVEKLAERAFQYYRAHKKVGDLIAKIESGTASPEEFQDAVKYLKIGGPRAAIGIF
jgi:hypothetical protein